MKSKKLEFPGHSGELLSARLDFPDEGEAKSFILFAHCFTCSKNLKAVGNIARALNEEGFAVFRFDFTGLGESEGDFANTNFSSNIDDLVAASNYLSEEYRAPGILVGHSLGGVAVLQAAHEIDSCKAVATIAAPSNPEHVKKNFKPKLDEIEEKGEAEVTLAGRSFLIKKQFLDDLDRANMNKRITNLGRALVIFHSPIDNTVGIDNAAEIFVQAKHPKSFISLDNADHLLSNEEDSRYVGSMLATWSSKYL